MTALNPVARRRVIQVGARIGGLYYELTGTQLEPAIRDKIEPTFESVNGSLAALREKFLMTAKLHEPAPLPNDPGEIDPNVLHGYRIRQAQIEQRITKLKEKLERARALAAAVATAAEHEEKLDRERAAAKTANDKATPPGPEPTLELHDLDALREEVTRLRHVVDNRAVTYADLANKAAEREAIRRTLCDLYRKRREHDQDPAMKIGLEIGRMNEVCADLPDEKKRWVAYAHEIHQRHLQKAEGLPERIAAVEKDLAALEQELDQRETPDDAREALAEAAKALAEAEQRVLTLEVENTRAREEHARRLVVYEAAKKTRSAARQAWLDADQVHTRALQQRRRLEREEEAHILPDGAEEELGALEAELARVKESVAEEERRTEARRVFLAAEAEAKASEAKRNVWLQLAVAADRLREERDGEAPKPVSRPKRKRRKRSA